MMEGPHKNDAFFAHVKKMPFLYGPVQLHTNEASTINRQYH